MLLLPKLKSLRRNTRLIQGPAMFGASLAAISVSVLLGCAQSQHSGIGSASDYGYAAETPEKFQMVSSGVAGPQEGHKLLAELQKVLAPGTPVPEKIVKAQPHRPSQRGHAGLTRP